MANAKNNKRALIEGRAALIMIDIQASTFIEDSLVSSIDNMPGYNERMLKARVAFDKARACNIPFIFIQEVHRPNLVDFGRKLDGDEDIHGLKHTRALVRNTGRDEHKLVRRWWWHMNTCANEWNENEGRDPFS